MAVKDIVKRYEKLKSSRTNWDDHWREVADLVVPRKNLYHQERTPGEKRTNHPRLFDSTAIQANELLASALHGLLTNPAVQWFSLTTGDEDLDREDDVRLWLQRTATRMHDVLNNSNFQTEVHELYLDLCSIGTGCMSVEEDENSIIRFSTKHMSKVYIDEDNHGKVDTVYRTFNWNARQIMLEFGDNMPPVIKKAAKDNDLRDFEILHCVAPEVGGRFPFKSAYILMDTQAMLSEGGFDEFPFVVPRWTKTSGETYGRSPAMKTLPDIKMINEVMKTTIKGAQKRVDPPLQMPDDGFVLPLKTTPGGINYYRSGTPDRIETFGNDAEVGLGYQVIEDIRTRIRQGFFIDQLQLAQGPAMTATEVLQRTEEKMRLLGPILGRQQSEFLRPLVDRQFDIMLKRNAINREEIPEVLSDAQIDVQYSSLIAKAQKSSELQNIVRAIELAAPFLQIDPGAAQNIDADEAVRFIAKTAGLPQKVIRSDREMQEIRQAQAEAQQAALQQQQEQQTVEQVATLAPVAGQLQS